MTFKPGEVATESRLNQDSTLLVGRVVFSATRAATQAIANATETAIIWDTVALDTLTAWSSGTPTRFTPNVAGWYVVSASAGWSTTAFTGNIGVFVRKNGVTIPGGKTQIHILWVAELQTVSKVIAVSLNGSTDYIDIGVRHTKGSSMDLTNSSDMLSVVTITYGGAL